MLNVLYAVVGFAQGYANTFYHQVSVNYYQQSHHLHKLGYRQGLYAAGQRPILAYGKLSAVMDKVFEQWRDVEVAFLEQVFSVKDNATVAFLTATLHNGLMQGTPDDIDFRDMVKVLKKIFYAQLMVTT
ncbi:hypothetical protein LY76DRAFT_652620 [Colletotrichum caudatum]|nr:hypothetical protein LY76DRAFT_652620 [Colletotrichum caudatum]